MLCKHDREIRRLEAQAQDAVDDGTWTPRMERLVSRELGIIDADCRRGCAERVRDEHARD